MTVSTLTTYNEAVAGGTVYTFTFRCDSAAWVKTYVAGVLKTTGITVALNADQDVSPGGSVTFGTAAAGVVRVQRETPLTQETNYTAYDAFPAETHELALDKAVMLVQDEARDRTDGAAESAALVAAEAVVRAAADAAEAAARAAADAAIIASGATPANVGIAPVIATGGSNPHIVSDWMAGIASPSAADIQYVESSYGDDENTGTSWRDAKRTILAAYDALGVNGGTIFIGDNSIVGGEVAQQGIWIRGPYETAPAEPGWRSQKGAVHIVGAVGGPTTQFRPDIHARIVTEGGWDTTTNTKPAIWLTGTIAGVTLKNIAVNGASTALRVGVPMNLAGGRKTIMSALFSAENCVFSSFYGSVNDNVNMGPAVDIGWCFWMWFTNCVVYAWPYVGAPNNMDDPVNFRDPRHACIYATNGSGLIYITNNIWNSGGFFYDSVGAGSVYIKNTVMEGDFAHPVPSLLWLHNCDLATAASVESCGIADAPGSDPMVWNDGGVLAKWLRVWGTGDVKGPAIVDAATSSNGGLTQLAAGQIGCNPIGLTDQAKRGFGPSTSVGSNLVSQTGAGWTGIGGATAGIKGPDGSTRAYSLPDTGSVGIDFGTYYLTPNGLEVGQRIFAGCWMRNIQTGYVGAPASIVMSVSSAYNRIDGTTYKGVSLGPYDNWVWVGFGATVTEKLLDNGGMKLEVASRLNSGLEFCYPCLMIIPAGQMTDNEFAEFVNYQQTVGTGVPAGEAGTLEGQKFYASAGVVIANSTQILTGAVDPSAASGVAASKGSLYLRTDGSTGTTLYVKTGTADTNWTAK